jgi:hypothetical protein
VSDTIDGETGRICDCEGGTLHLNDCPAADDRARVPGDAGDEDRQRAAEVATAVLTEALDAGSAVVADALAAERSRAEEKHVRLMEALEKLANRWEFAYEDANPWADDLRAVIEANR